MLDPLSALSVASSVVQLIDFGAHLTRTASEIHEKGSSVELRHLAKVTTDLAGLNAALKLRARCDLGLLESLTKEEQVSLCAPCQFKLLHP
jgi:hypothetical protein